MKECLNRNHWTSLLEARVVTGDIKHDQSHRQRHSAVGRLAPDEYGARCNHTHHRVACANDEIDTNTIWLYDQVTRRSGICHQHMPKSTIYKWVLT